MRLVFAGTPQFAATALEALLAAGFEIGLVLTQPDRRAGRGLHPHPSAVKAFACAHGLPLAQPASLKEPALQDQLRVIGAAAIVVAAYGLILPASVLAIPVRGCLNIHASLLPRWRGAAPIQRALLAGDRETGITIMQMDAGLDTGAIVLQEKIPINDEDTTQTLHVSLAALGARCIVRALHEHPLPRAQDDAAATYAAKIAKAETAIIWSRSAYDICRQIRAFNPAPGAVTTLNGAALKIWRAYPAGPVSARPGTVVSAAADGIVVATGDGAVCITELQKAGGKRLFVPAFVSGAALTPGTPLGT
ncbi:MAG TPA: methionyl-tRNA formyltransferase [Burkholderiales bacterium]|nr:methionyl-tRNA formyltransferase [Burkholderiales bacterium]